RTSRECYNRLFKPGDADPTNFARWGRGVSFHDFAIALNIEPRRIPVTSAKELFLRSKTNTNRAFGHAPWRRYEAFIRDLAPEVHHGFFLPWVDVILNKPAEVRSPG